MTEHCLNLQLYLRYSWTFHLRKTLLQPSIMVINHARRCSMHDDAHCWVICIIGRERDWWRWYWFKLLSTVANLYLCYMSLFWVVIFDVGQCQMGREEEWEIAGMRKGQKKRDGQERKARSRMDWTTWDHWRWASSWTSGPLSPTGLTCSLNWCGHSRYVLYGRPSLHIVVWKSSAGDICYKIRASHFGSYGEKQFGPWNETVRSLGPKCPWDTSAPVPKSPDPSTEPVLKCLGTEMSGYR